MSERFHSKKEGYGMGLGGYIEGKLCWRISQVGMIEKSMGTLMHLDNNGLREEELKISLKNLQEKRSVDMIGIEYEVDGLPNEKVRNLLESTDRSECFVDRLKGKDTALRICENSNYCMVTSDSLCVSIHPSPDVQDVNRLIDSWHPNKSLWMLEETVGQAGSEEGVPVGSKTGCKVKMTNFRKGIGDEDLDAWCIRCSINEMLGPKGSFLCSTVLPNNAVEVGACQQTDHSLGDDNENSGKYEVVYARIDGLRLMSFYSLTCGVKGEFVNESRGPTSDGNVEGGSKSKTCLRKFDKSFSKGGELGKKFLVSHLETL
ncbi:hypothetical protein C1645_831251 [Glomus cerebriforme]|uniref:Uncharacterized protein n=1 Tax=Glomus cerebriforme TaxID=658196 RepID=A0A397SM15_9GLOM|nr:hypothetical protein C1645_831251 [Glomus cerebriforme]